jgi:N-methylhydantoinase B
MAAEEGGLAAARAAGSPFISSGNAIACAIFDARGGQVTQTAGGLLHVSALRIMLRELLAEIDPASLAEGDVLISNDHFRGGIHPTDVGIFRPVFCDGRLVYFCAAMMIVSDLGGMAAGGLPANATEIFHEGLVIPPLRYWSRGQPEAGLRALIRANSRAPEKVIGDIDALVAGTGICAARLGELLDKHGAAKLAELIDRLIDYGARMTRAGIEKLPDGSFDGSYAMEGDGIETDRDFVVRCRVTIDGARCRLDFSGTDPQARGPINASYSQALSGAVYALRCYLDPDIPMNEGFYWALEVELPQGSLVNPDYPAACNLRMGTVHAMLDAVNQALAGKFPERVAAPGSMAATANASGVKAEGARTWTLLDVYLGVGGARFGLDGVDGTPSPLYSMSGWDRSIESYEAQYPVEYLCFRLDTDSAGAGTWRGGTGIVKEIRFDEDAWLTVRSADRFARPPAGLAGGRPGSGGAWIVNRGRRDELRLPAKKTNHLIRAGEILTCIGGGGGGIGDPLARDVAAVERDVRAGLVSPAAALREYGVSIDARGRGRRP